MASSVSREVRLEDDDKAVKARLWKRVRKLYID